VLVSKLYTRDAATGMIIDRESNTDRKTAVTDRILFMCQTASDNKAVAMIRAA
jgi:hypothetical protein